jgi:acetyltransferase-like isoleucine patch superfamily enzyme
MNRRGQVLVAAIFVLVIVSFLGLIVAQMLSTEGFSAIKNLHGIQALNVAEGGMRWVVATQLAPDSDWSNNTDLGPIALGPGTFSLHYFTKQTRSATFEVVGTVQGVNRTIRTGYRRTGGGLSSIAAEYVLYWGGTGMGDSSLGNNVTINGNILVNNNIDLNDADVNGTVEATGDITGATNVSGTAESHVATPEGQPTLETSSYDALINIANTTPTYTGNRTFSGALSPGIYYVKGNVTLGDLTLTGVTTIVATGTITTNSNIHIGDNFTAIAAGAIEIGNSVSLGNNGLWYSSTSISQGNHAEDSIFATGYGTAFITPGSIDFGNSPASAASVFEGYMYAGGTIHIGNNMEFAGLMTCNNAIIGNGSTLTLDQSAVNSDLPGIITGGISGAGEFAGDDWVEFY